MAVLSSKLQPIRFPLFETDFTKTNSEVAQECTRPGVEWFQCWSDADTLTLYFNDDEGVNAPLIGIFDENDLTTALASVFPTTNNGFDYWYDIPLAPFTGRNIFLRYGHFTPAFVFVTIADSEIITVLSDSDDRVQNCSVLIDYYSCALDLAWNWDTTDATVVPLHVPSVRIFDSFIESSLDIEKTISETYGKTFTNCNVDVNFDKELRVEFSPLWWHEKLTLITLARNVQIDGVLYIQQVGITAGEKYRNMPLFKGTGIFRRAEIAVPYRYGCC